MPELITYESTFNIPITTAEARHSSAYYKVYHAHGHIKKKEHYKGDQLTELIYYKDPEEFEEAAVTTIRTTYRLDYFEVRERVAYGPFRVERARMYDKGIFDNYKLDEVYDAQGRLICEHTDSTFKGIRETETRKYWFDPQTNIEIECRYDQAGALVAVMGSGSPFVAENDYTIWVGADSRYFPDFTAQDPYYATAEFLPCIG